MRRCLLVSLTRVGEQPGFLTKRNVGATATFLPIGDE